LVRLAPSGKRISVARGGKEYAGLPKGKEAHEALGSNAEAEGDLVTFLHSYRSEREGGFKGNERRKRQGVCLLGWIRRAIHAKKKRSWRGSKLFLRYLQGKEKGCIRQWVKKARGSGRETSSFL